MLDRCNPDRLLDRPFERDPVELVAACTPLPISLLSTDHQLGVAGLDVLCNDVVPEPGKSLLLDRKQNLYGGAVGQAHDPF